MGKISRLILSCRAEAGLCGCVESRWVLFRLVGQTPSGGRNRYFLRGWNSVRKGGLRVFVTVRGSRALELLEATLRIKNFDLGNVRMSAGGSVSVFVSRHVE